AASNIVVVASSSVQSVIANSNIVLTATQAGPPENHYIVTLKPNLHAFGTSTISLVVTDRVDNSTVSGSFDFIVTQVNNPPTIVGTNSDGSISTQAAPAGTTTPNIPFSVSDPDPGQTLTITATSSDQSLVKDSN